jgi:glycosyltransferase involved in cell wall biosynthesis
MMADPVATIGIDARFLLHGVGRYVEELLTHLAQAGGTHGYHVFTRRSGRESPPLPCLWGERFREIPGRGSLYGPAGQLGIPYHAARRGLQLFHATSFPSPLIRVCPLVVTIHDQAPRLDRRRLPFRTGARGLLARTYYDLMNAYAIRHARHIISVSQQARQDILRFHPDLPPGKISVIYHGVSDRFRPAEPAEQARVRARHALPPQQYFLYVGTVNPGKNLVRVLEAFDQLRKAGAWTHKLVAVARRDPRYHEFYRFWERYPNRDSVILLDYVETADLPGLYSGALALVFPSQHESFGFPVLEAFACGTPVITSNVSALPEIAGGAALLVDPNSVEAIADACRQLARNSGLRRQLIDKGRRRARDFSWARCAQQTLAIYEGVLSGRLQ